MPLHTPCLLPATLRVSTNSSKELPPSFLQVKVSTHCYIFAQLSLQTQQQLGLSISLCPFKYLQVLQLQPKLQPKLQPPKPSLVRIEQQRPLQSLARLDPQLVRKPRPPRPCSRSAKENVLPAYLKQSPRLHKSRLDKLPGCKLRTTGSKERLVLPQAKQPVKVGKETLWLGPHDDPVKVGHCFSVQHSFTQRQRNLLIKRLRQVMESK